MQEQKPDNFLSSFLWPLVFVAFIWVFHLAQISTGVHLGNWGILPRQIIGLRGILFAPLIHSGFPHLLSNSVPLVLLGGVIVYFYRRVALRSIILIYVLTGIFVWLMARNSFHIGASGVVYGLVSFVFWNGIFRRSLRSIVLALVVTVMYSGYFAGLLPNQEGISWESHLYGALVGIFTSFFYKEELEIEEEVEKNYAPFANEEDNKERPFFLDRNVFEKTKKQREQERNSDSDWTSTNTWS